MTTDEIKILTTTPLTKNEIDKLRDISPRFQFIMLAENKHMDKPEEIWEQAEILYTNNILPDPELAPNLRWVHLQGVGIDVVLDNPLLLQKDITFTTSSGTNAAQMAEFALMAILTLGHGLTEILEYQRNGIWDEDFRNKWTPKEIRDSTVGIVGYGSIGRELARLLRPLTSNILAIKRTVMHPSDSGYTPDGLGDPDGNLFLRLYPIQALKSMLKKCDFVVVALPLTKETHQLFGKEELEAMKPSAFLVNISRGKIFDHDALYSTLKNGQIRGALLDVFPEEPLPPDNPLWQLANTIISPHIADNSELFSDRNLELFQENLNRYITGSMLLNRLDLQKGY